MHLEQQIVEPSLYNARTKAYMYKWRSNNKAKYNAICRKGQAKYRERNKDRINEARRLQYREKNLEKRVVEKGQREKS